MNKIFCLVLCLILSTYISAYEAKIAIPDQQAESRSIAIKTALQEILLKASNNKNILKQADIKKAIKKSANFVQQYRFSREAPENNLFIHITFYQQEIERLVGQNLAPKKVSIPPKEVTTWILLEDQILGMESEWAHHLQQTAQHQKVKLLLPLLDLEDQAMMTYEKLSQFDIEAIKNASIRYQTALILALHLQKKDKIYSANAILISQQNEAGWQKEGTKKEVLNDLFAFIKQQQITNPSITTDFISQGEVKIIINDIIEAKDYFQVQQYFASEPLIISSRIIQMKGTQLVLEIKLQGDLFNLEQQPRFSSLFEKNLDQYRFKQSLPEQKTHEPNPD